MKKLEDMTADELREYADELDKKNRPRPLSNIDTEAIIKFAESLINDYVEFGYSKDDEHYAYETLLMAVYGPDIFNWVNEHNEGC